MEKRALLAFVLSLLVLFVYQSMFQTPVDQGERRRTPETGAVADREPAEVIPPVPQEEEALTGEFPVAVESEGVGEEIVTVETEVAQYRISTRGAVFKEITLKKYFDHKKARIRLISPESSVFPIQMISQGRPFTIPFVASARSIVIRRGDDPQVLTLRYDSSQGGFVEKRFVFHSDSYHTDITISQNIATEYGIVVGSHALEFRPDEAEGRYSHIGPVLDLMGDIERIKLKKIKERTVLKGDIPWVAHESKYFMTSLFPEQKGAAAVLDPIEGELGGTLVFSLSQRGEAFSGQFYAGPKDYELLKSYGNGLEGVINFGVFGVLGKPMFFILKSIYNVVKSYGLAIIILTTLIKIVFIPLTHKQQKSMQEMQRIQPEISAIREKYKSDPQSMNREVMALYKKYKVNPAAGCLPLLIQIPVFFALYNVLLSAIELRQTPFLYISDLSAADTLFGHLGGFAVGPLPLLMGASMYYQQKLTPTTMDPRQAKIFQWMPVIFTIMFLNFPSGLVLYWLVNNVLTIVQQIYINSRKERTVS